jgi:type I restriction enzyme S subunit
LEQELASLRDWLLPMLMNGQVKVGEAEAKVKEYVQEGEVGMAAEDIVNFINKS